MFLPYDVDRRLRLEYDPQEVIEIYAAFDDLQRDVPKVNARVLRCIVHLAEGDVRRLLELVDNARADYRDVVLWAEYDQKGKVRVRDFSRAF